jgi:nonspecific dipeptidase
LLNLKQLRELGATVELADIGMQTLPDGSQIPLPPLVFGQLGSDPSKKTVLIYGHLDVQPAALVNLIPHECPCFYFF